MELSIVEIDMFSCCAPLGDPFKKRILTERTDPSPETPGSAQVRLSHLCSAAQPSGGLTSRSTLVTLRP